MTAPITASRDDVLRFRFARHQLDRAPASAKRVTDVDLLDYGVQDTGVDGALWALAARGAAVDATSRPDDLAFAWTLRGAPHAYRRDDLVDVARATTPFSDADAAKRIFDASKPLKAAGIGILDALRHVADEMRTIVATPIVKGEVSGRLTDALGEPYLRFCRACNATHIYEQPFRLSALQAGLELTPSTSPPVLVRVEGMQPPRFDGDPSTASADHHVVRNYVRFYGPARASDAAAFIDAAGKDVKANWPADVVEVAVEGERTREPRWLLEDDVPALTKRPAGRAKNVVRLLGPYDPYLQLRDRELLVPDATRRKDLWRVLGRPGAIVVDGDVIGTWRPKSSGTSLTITVELWSPVDAATTAAIATEGERLAAHRGVRLKDLAGLR